MVIVYKETSQSIVMCYEGTTVGGQNHKGVLNITRTGNMFYGLAKAEDGFSCSLLGVVKSNGSFSETATTVFGGMDVTVTFSGTFFGNGVSGTWSNSWELKNNPGQYGSNSGTFTGTRTL